MVNTFVLAALLGSSILAPAAPHATADAVAAVVQEHTSDPTAPAASLEPAVTLTGATYDQRTAVGEALARFHGAGLPLPDLEIVFHDDPADCKGHDGLFQPQHAPWRVLVCSDLPYVLTHELAHAWEAANLDDDDRRHYLDHRGLDTWNDRDADWRERGIEDAAVVVQQVLMTRHVDPSSDRWIERADAYETLTGNPAVVGDAE